MVLLEFVGKPSPRRNLNAFHDELRGKYPSLTERGIHEVTQAELEKTPPRYPGYVLHFFSDDILTADLTTLPTWHFFSKAEQRDMPRRTMEQRRRLVDPKGMSQTYVWRRENDWLQDVTGADVEVIRRSAARTWFRNVERHGPWTPERAYEFPVIESHPMTSKDDIEAFQRDRERKPTWHGLLLP